MSWQGSGGKCSPIPLDREELDLLIRDSFPHVIWAWEEKWPSCTPPSPPALPHLIMTHCGLREWAGSRIHTRLFFPVTNGQSRTEEPQSKMSDRGLLPTRTWIQHTSLHPGVHIYMRRRPTLAAMITYHICSTRTAPVVPFSTTVADDSIMLMAYMVDGRAGLQNPASPDPTLYSLILELSPLVEVCNSKPWFWLDQPLVVAMKSLTSLRSPF